MSEEEEKCLSSPGGLMRLAEPCQGLCLAFCVCWVRTEGSGSESFDRPVLAGVAVCLPPFPGHRQAPGTGVRVAGQPSAPRTPLGPGTPPHPVFLRKDNLPWVPAWLWS